MNQVATVADTKAPLKAGGSLGAIVPQDAEQAFRMAQLIVRAGMAPRGMEQPEKVVTAIMHGLEIGLKPMQAVQSIAIVNGRPAVWGDASIGLVRGSGLCQYVKEWIEGQGDAAVAHCETHRIGEPSPVARTFSVADAKKAGLWGKSGPWSQYPLRMLQMRARSFCLRDVYADILKGLQIVEEVRDYRPFAGEQQSGGAAASVTAALAAPNPELQHEPTPEPDADQAEEDPAEENAAAAAMLNAIAEAASPKAVAAIMDREQTTLAGLYRDDREAHGRVLAAAKAKGWIG